MTLLMLALVLNRTPPEALAPNRAHGNYGEHPRREAAAILRRDAGLSFGSQMVKYGMTAPVFTGAVDVDVTINWEKYAVLNKDRLMRKYRHRVDKDASIAMLKSVFDALQDVGILANDRQIAGIDVRQAHDPNESGCCHLVIRALETPDRFCPACGRVINPATVKKRLIGMYCERCRVLIPA